MGCRGTVVDPLIGDNGLSSHLARAFIDVSLGKTLSPTLPLEVKVGASVGQQH